MKKSVKHSLSRKVSRSPAANGSESASTPISPIKSRPSTPIDNINLPLISPDGKVNSNTRHRNHSSSVKKNVEHLPPVSINWLDQQATYDELRTYIRYDVDVPLTQEDQLELLMDKFTLRRFEGSFYYHIG